MKQMHSNLSLSSVIEIYVETLKEIDSGNILTLSLILLNTEQP